MTVTYLVGDVFDRLAEIPDQTVDLVVTSPPFLALRSYLPEDHPDKSREIGSEANPAEFLTVMLDVTSELRRVLAPHGSIAIELGDTYSGSGGAGGDYLEGGQRDGQESFTGAGRRDKTGWPLSKSKALIPELYRVALAYGINPLTGVDSPAGKWLVRNVVTWCRPNPAVGALGDKWRPATSDIVVACLSPERYWDDVATRQPLKHEYRKEARSENTKRANRKAGGHSTLGDWAPTLSTGAPLLDWWKIPPGGYKGPHYAVYPPAVVEPVIKAMCPHRVCRTCGEPSRPTTEKLGLVDQKGNLVEGENREGGILAGKDAHSNKSVHAKGVYSTSSWSDCGHNNWRPGVVLDPFAGTGTTLAVAAGHGYNAIGIDLDGRNVDLAVERIGGLFMTVKMRGEKYVANIV